MQNLERRLRLATGLLVAAYVLGHFLNHALGIASVEAMDAARRVLAGWWRSAPGTMLLYGALLVHFLLALLALARRRTLRMPAWEAFQLLLGLAVMPLLISHIMGTRFAWSALDREVDYARIVGVLWADSSLVLKQVALLMVVWLHLCFGLHFWLRVRPWYPRAVPLLYAAALLVPVLSIAGFVSAGIHGVPPVPQPISDADRALAAQVRESIEWAFWGLLGAALAWRLARRWRRGSYRIHHASGVVLAGTAGSSLLESIREAGLAHASVCGGRARCTTCRVRVAAGLQQLPPPSALEAEALARIGADPNIRLACQVRPSADVWVTPLVPAHADINVARRPGGVGGRERQVAAMFVDLRGSTAMSENRLPYDVVFVLNQFFAEMAEALAASGGHYAQFAGDGLLALYGLEGEIGPACRQALEGAALMQQRIDRLNARLAPELAQPLRIGIGLHAGLAIVGTMGPPAAPIISAVGDPINAAARLEALSKHFGCTLVVSLDTLRFAGIPVPDAPVHRARIRGKTQQIDVLAIDDPLLLARAAPEAVGQAVASHRTGRPK
jgi:adenylate cyclase